MGSLIEVVIEKLHVPISSHNSSIIRQINKYEQDRLEALKKEHLASLLADQAEASSLVKTTATLRKEEELLRAERERYEKNIADLISKLEPNSKQ